jgi:hypothetical protein
MGIYFKCVSSWAKFDDETRYKGEKGGTRREGGRWVGGREGFILNVSPEEMQEGGTMEIEAGRLRREKYFGLTCSGVCSKRACWTSPSL